MTYTLTCARRIPKLLRFEVLTPVSINISINITVIWLVTPIICVNRYQRFGVRGLKASGI